MDDRNWIGRTNHQWLDKVVLTNYINSNKCFRVNHMTVSRGDRIYF